MVRMIKYNMTWGSLEEFESFFEAKTHARAYLSKTVYRSKDNRYLLLLTIYLVFLFTHLFICHKTTWQIKK